MLEVEQKRRFFSKRDIIIIAALILTAGIWLFVKYFFVNSGATAAEIYYNSKIVKTVTLTPGLNEKFAVPGQPEVILQVKGGKICFYSSTCKNKICIKSGFLSRPGESAACLPNKVAIKIVAVGNGKTSGPDTYAT